MTDYVLNAGHGTFSVNTTFTLIEGGNHLNTQLIYRNVAESQWVINRFTRWSENNTNGETVTYKVQPSSFGPTIYYGL